MELVIHGTKGGYKAKLFSTTEAPLSLGDFRNGVNTEYPLGEYLYSIAFIEQGYIYTKYIIVRDSLRNFATGTLAFSIYLKADKEIVGKGVNVVALLNKLSNHYQKNYIKDDNINSGETNLIQEDWNFVNPILSEFNEQQKTNKDEGFISGIKDPAFIYYKNENELVEYFDKPFQEEYKEYKQVYFINEILRDSEKNPLNVLSNSGVELKNIDLKDNYYYLKHYSRSKGIKISANGKELSDGKYNNCIRAKMKVNITFSKNEKCFDKIDVTGTLSDRESKIFEYLELKDNNILIKYEAFTNPNPKVKNIIFELKDFKGNFIEGAEIQIGTQPRIKISGHRYVLELKGEELIERFNVEVTNGNFWAATLVTPEISSEPITLILNQSKIVEINLKDEATGNDITEFSVWTKLTNSYTKTKKLIFIDDLINDTYDIKIKKYGYEEKIIYGFEPHKQNHISETLKLSNCDNGKKAMYNISAGEFGEKSHNCPGYSNFENASDLTSKYIIPRKGWKFTEWKLDNETNVLIAQYEKKIPFIRKPIHIIGIGFIVMFLGLSIWYVTSKMTADEKIVLISESTIETYLNGISLSMDTLNNYKSNWDLRNPSSQKANKFSIDYWLPNNRNNKEYSELSLWEIDRKRIENAINLRKSINDKDFKELKELHFSIEQEEFKKSINSIQSVDYQYFDEQLGDVSTLSLNEISSKIDKIKANKQPGKNQTIEEPDEVIQKGNTSAAASNSYDIDESANNESLTPDEKKNRADIIKYLKGDNIKLADLENYRKNTEAPDLKKSIEMALLLWSLDGSSNKSHSSYLQILKEDKILKDSKLISIVKVLDSKNIYVKDISGNKSMSIQQLQSK